MARIITCPRGHRWEALEESPVSQTCPVCAGTAGPTVAPTAPLAPPDSQDTEDLDTVTAEEVSDTPFTSPRLPGYEILGVLGRGGMGVVYRARQISLNRLVALKMILAGEHAGPEQRSRFRREAEAVARLQHPNIVQIYEVGEQDGRPYFSLEYVEGGTLAGRLAGTPQPARPAAELVETLARAVHFAHERGIVHRDLKPANILLSGGRQPPETAPGQGADAPRSGNPVPALAGGSRLNEGVPKVTDFGLAKHLDQEHTQTQSGALLGTPSYMAPEQAWGRSKVVPVGPAADVYALGAILYECLTGRPPFRGENPLDTLEQVWSRDPVPPSRLQPKVPRDLETICLKCLEKDPGRRYGSARDLADDLRRFRAGEPIRARPVGLAQRLVKWVRRRPVQAALLGVILLLVLGLVAGGLVTNARLRSAVETTQHQRDRAEANYRKMLEAVDQMLTQVGDQRLAEVPEMEEVRRELLEKALRFYQDLLRDRGGDDSALRAETARASYRSGVIHKLLGYSDRAAADFRRAADLLEKLAAESPDAPAYRYELANVHLQRGELYGGKRPRQAEAEYRRAIALYRSLPADVPQYRAALAAGYSSRAMLVQSPRRWKEAGQWYRRALALQRALVRDLPHQPELRKNLAVTLLNQGLLFHRTGRLDRAGKYYREARALLEPLVGDHPRTSIYPNVLSSVCNNLAALAIADGRGDAAEKFYRRVLALRTRLARRFPSTPYYRRMLAETRGALAKFYLESGRPARAAAEMGRALELWESLVEGSPRVEDYDRKVVEFGTLLGGIQERAGRPAEAGEAFRKAERGARRLLRRHPRDLECRVAVGTASLQYGQWLWKNKRHKEAVACCTRAITALEAVLKKDPGRFTARLTLKAAYGVRAAARKELGQLPGALADLFRFSTLRKAPAPKAKRE
jgi:tetratricopeptide (TPR) repeat protein